MDFNKFLDNVKIYEAGKPIELVVREYGIEPQNILKLASNENPYGCSPKVSEIIKEVSQTASIYPDDSFYELKDSLANRFNLKSENIVIGAGSDQVIEFIIRSKCNENSKILIAGITFAMYEIYAKSVGAKVIKTESIEHNLEQFLKLYKTEKPDVIFLCLPNNPLGECLDKKDIFNFIKEIDNNTMVVVDGAYQEYASFKDKNKEIKPKELIEKFENTIYLGTFSKAYGLGGMRVGYGISNSEIIKTMHKLRPPFNITTLSLKASIEALKDETFVLTSIKNNFTEMDRFLGFTRKNSIEYINSFTNFLTIRLNRLSSKDIAQKLLEKGIIIRDLSGYGINAIRVTIGKSEQNTRFLEELNKLII